MSPAIRDGLITCAFAWLLAGTFMRAVIVPMAPGWIPAPTWWMGAAEFVVSTLIWPRYVARFARGFRNSWMARRR